VQKLLRDIADFVALPHADGIGTNTVVYHYKFGDGLGRRYASRPEMPL
jgi:hypothetical protein